MATPDQIAQFKLDNWQHALAVSKQTGVDPRIVMAQAGVESDWGNAAPGNNFHGIKGPGQILNTTEAGPDGKLVPTAASFRTFDSPAHSFASYASLPIVQKVGQAGDYGSQIAALGKSGYATAPNYAGTIDKVASGLTVPEGVTPSTLPVVPIAGSTPIDGPGPAGAGVVAPTPPPPDPNANIDQQIADWSKYGVTDKAVAGLLAANKQQRLNSLTGAAQGLLAQGAPQQSWQPQAVPLLQAHRGQPVPFPDFILKRGLLG